MRGIRLALAAMLLSWPAAASAEQAIVVIPATPPRAEFGGEVVSTAARRVADWALLSGDHADLPFVIVDKLQARVYVFDGGGNLVGATSALLGRARGDESAPGIGTRALSAIPASQRTTPAGRFVAFLGRDFEHDLLWIDYAISLSMHRVIAGNPGDHRAQRLANTSLPDKRISYGCINVPAAFYEQIVVRTFTGTRGIVYILPEVKSLHDIFPIPDEAEHRDPSQTASR